MILDDILELNFFFQAEDGIRDADVTGVQTCALPILASMLFNALPNAQIQAVEIRRAVLMVAHQYFSLPRHSRLTTQDRKSTRLNSSHVRISYAVFCLKKKKQTPNKAPLFTYSAHRFF